MTISDTDLVGVDSDTDLVGVESRSARNSRPRRELTIPSFGEIVDYLDDLEIDGQFSWRLPDRSDEHGGDALDESGSTRLDENDEGSARTVNPDRFRQALAHLPAPVTLVTCADDDGAPIGATVSAFSSLSLDPPLVMVSLDRRSGTLAAIRSRQAFAVHVLGDAHQPLAIRFAERRADKFDELEFACNDRGVPLLPHYSFRFECILHDEFPGGDHAVVIGAVEELSEHDVSQDPVVWYGRSFRRLTGD